MDNLHGTKGNVTESAHEVRREIEKLVGGVALRGSMARQINFINMLQVLDVIRERSVHMSADWYLEALNYVESQL